MPWSAHWAVSMAARSLPWPPQVNAQRTSLCDAATALLCMSSLAAGSGQSAAASVAAAPAAAAGDQAAGGLAAVGQAQELAWELCETLGSRQALMDRHGRFVQVRGPQGHDMMHERALWKA